MFDRDMGAVLAAGMGAQLQQAVSDRAWDFFTYSAEFTNLAASGVANRDIPIQSDSHFLAMAATLTARQNATPETVVDPPPLTIEIFDSGSGRAMFDRAQDARNVTGTGERPTYWPFYRLIRPGSSLRVTITNLDAATALDVRFSMLGVKVFNTNPGR